MINGKSSIKSHVADQTGSASDVEGGNKGLTAPRVGRQRSQSGIAGHSQESQKAGRGKKKSHSHRLKRSRSADSHQPIVVRSQRTQLDDAFKTVKTAKEFNNNEQAKVPQAQPSEQSPLQTKKEQGCLERICCCCNIS